MHEDVKWLFGLILIFGVVWYASGSFNKVTSQKPFIQPLSTGDGVRYNSAGRITSGSGRMQERASTAGGQIRSGGTQISATAEVAQTLRDVQPQAEKIQKQTEQVLKASKAPPTPAKI